MKTEVLVSDRLYKACVAERDRRAADKTYMGSTKLQDVIRDLLRERLSELSRHHQ